VKILRRRVNQMVVQQMAEGKRREKNRQTAGYG
jgi:hypothetical protein